MNILIITINILLLSLILYNMLSKGDKLLENLETCSPQESAKHNAVTAKINNQYNILDRLRKKKKEADSTVGTALFKILFSGQVSGKSTKKLTEKKGKEMDKINKAGGDRDEGGEEDIKYKAPDGKLGKILSVGPE